MQKRCEKAKNVTILKSVLVLLDFIFIYLYRINFKATYLLTYSMEQSPS